MLIGGKRRVDGLTLRATDTDWSPGSGPRVEGPAVALMLTTTGRKQAPDELTGPGVDTRGAPLQWREVTRLYATAVTT